MKKIDILTNWIKLNISFFENLKESKELNNFNSVKISDLYNAVHLGAQPCFVLSTGRCGTMLLTKILETSPSVKVIHSPSPEPTWHSNWAYHSNFKNPKCVEAVVDALRYEEIRNAFIQKKRYVETSNRITFFAHAISILYPKSIFIHLYRAPISFVRSGLNRNWYSNSVITDEGRLQPDNTNLKWKNMNRVDKIAWLWQETNMYIEEFKTSIDPNRVLEIPSESLFNNSFNWESLNTFLNLKLLPTKIIDLLSHPVNSQKINSTLTSQQISSIQKIATLSSKYYRN